MLGTDLDAETAQRKQAVPFLLWANYDIPEADGMELSINYLSSLLTECAGIPQTSYQRFLAALWAEVPVVNAVGFLDGDGTWSYDATQLSQDAQQGLASYEMLQYNAMFESPRSRLEGFFSRPST